MGGGKCHITRCLLSLLALHQRYISLGRHFCNYQHKDEGTRDVAVSYADNKHSSEGRFPLLIVLLPILVVC